MQHRFLPLSPSITGLNEETGRYSPGAMSTTSSGHAAVQRAHEPSKEGCRGISTRADDARWVVSSRPRASVLQAALAAFVIIGIFQMYFRAQNAEARHLATVYLHKFRS